MMPFEVKSTNCAWGAIGAAALAAVVLWLFICSLIWAIILFFPIAVGVMWFFCRPVADGVADSGPSPVADEPAKPAAPTPAPAPKAAPKAKAKPEPKPEPKAEDATPDDLTKLKGVGPKLAAAMNDAGIHNFAQIAAWKAKDVAWADENIKGFNGRASRDEWVKQAKALVKAK